MLSMSSVTMQEASFECIQAVGLTIISELWLTRLRGAVPTPRARQCRRCNGGLLSSHAMRGEVGAGCLGRRFRRGSRLFLVVRMGLRRTEQCSSSGEHNSKSYVPMMPKQIAATHYVDRLENRCRYPQAAREKQRIRRRAVCSPPYFSA